MLRLQRSVREDLRCTAADPAEERFKKQAMNMGSIGKSGKDIIRGLLDVCYAKGKLEAVEKLICLVFLVFRIMKDKSITSRFQPAQHQLNATDHEHAFTCLRELLIVSTVPA